jgi:hypothetical protein
LPARRSDVSAGCELPVRALLEIASPALVAVAR